MADEQPGAGTLERARIRARSCTRCPALVASRSQVVVGGGAADADVMLVADAPGAGEDALGLPLGGRAAKLLDELLAEAGYPRGDVWVTSIVKCRPPGSRDPSPAEVANCSEHLEVQVELVRPVVVVALGSFVTKLLRGDPAPIRERRGRAEARAIGSRPAWLLPVFHPAAALYGQALTEQLREDLARVPALVTRGAPQITVADPVWTRAATQEGLVAAPAATPGQLGLF